MKRTRIQLLHSRAGTKDDRHSIAQFTKQFAAFSEVAERRRPIWKEIFEFLNIRQFDPSENSVILKGTKYFVFLWMFSKGSQKEEEIFIPPNYEFEFQTNGVVPQPLWQSENLAQFLIEAKEAGYQVLKVKLGKIQKKETSLKLVDEIKFQVI